MSCGKLAPLIWWCAVFKTLLPPNATPTERRLEQSLAYDMPLWPQVAGLAQLRRQRPAPLAPWLAAEWGIASYRPYFADDAALVDALLPWLRMRGTAQAVKVALGVIGVPHPTLSVEHFYLHIDLPTPYLGALSEFKRAVNDSVPLHLAFYRLTAGEDLRHGRYDDSRYDDSLYDDDSGIFTDDIKLSYRASHGRQGRVTATATRQTTLITPQRSPHNAWHDRATWDDLPWTSRIRYQITKETV